MSINPNKLLITSAFYSCQGEGISTGIPAYFVRLGICNLSCGMSKTFLNTIVRAGADTIADGAIFAGDLHQSGKATWTCDSTSQWALRGESRDFQWLIDQWKSEGVYEDILNGSIHIIWTGGEPTIPKHQESIVNFFKYWDTLEQNDGLTYVFSEIETNGTFPISDDLSVWINQINCSPKLSNSGMTEKQRINPEAIRNIMGSDLYQFKFVISNEDDVKEIFDTFIRPFEIPLSTVVCMPGMDSRDEFHERTKFVMEMAKKYRFRGMTRLHISAWDKTLNV